MTRQYSKGASKEVEKEMHKYKKDEAYIGKSDKKVKSKKQAIAIGLSKAREKGERVPKKKE